MSSIDAEAASSSRQRFRRGRDRPGSGLFLCCLFAVLFLFLPVPSFSGSNPTVPSSPVNKGVSVHASISATPPSSKPVVELTAEERAWLKAHPVIRVVQDPGSPPVEFADKAGQPSGIAADYVSLIEKRLGVKFKRMQTPSWQEAYGRLRTWEVDVTPAVSRTPDRETFWAFTKPYMNMPVVIVAQSDVTYIGDMRELAGKRVVVVDGYAVSDWIARDYPDILLTKARDTQEALELLKRGNVFAYIDNMLVVSYYITRLKLANVKIAGTTPYVNAQSMAVRKDWPILAGILQKALDSITEEERAEVYLKWVPVRYEHGFNYSRLWQVLAVCALVFGGLVVWIRKLSREIDHRKKAEERLKKSEQKLRVFLERAPTSMAMFDRNMRYLAASRQWYAEYLPSGEEIIGRSHYEVFPDVPERWREAHRRCLAGATERCDEDIHLRSDGRTMWRSWEAVPWYEPGGSVGGIIILTQDITKRKQAQAAIARSEAKFRSYVENSPLAIFVADSQGRIIDVNRAAIDLLGYNEETLSRMHVWDLHPEEDSEEGRSHFAVLCREGHSDTEFRLRRADGSLLWVSLYATTIGDGSALAYCSDITSRKQAEEALMKTTGRLLRAEEVSRTGAWELDPLRGIIQVSVEAARITGLPGPEWSVDDFVMIQLPQYGETVREAIRRLIEENVPYDEEFKIRHAGTGEIIDVRCLAEYDPERKTAFGVIQDITEKKRLEEQLRQAQKMEAVGTLAGGVAHDFNNILTIVMGFGNLLQMSVHPEDHLRPYIDQIVQSAEKASQLTKSLLAFSRKQMIALDPHRVGEVVSGTSMLLKRLLTEDIELTVEVTEDDDIALIDLAQFDQVLMNLATNARDAMPRGGTITIRTGVTRIDEAFKRAHGFGRPGAYVSISFADTGTGMDEKTMERIFDPFFTTKELGKGTGLGLASVYGIVKQHGGYITVKSKPMEGTTFDVYLPLIDGGEPPLVAPVDIPRGTEKILVVEDDVDVRRMIVTALADQGYTAVEAADGEEAIRVFSERRDEIEMALLDVVMPGRNGKEVFDAITRIKPELRAIFVSGYTGDVILDKGGTKGQDGFPPEAPLGDETAKQGQGGIGQKRMK